MATSPERPVELQPFRVSNAWSAAVGRPQTTASLSLRGRAPQSIRPSIATGAADFDYLGSHRATRSAFTCLDSHPVGDALRTRSSSPIFLDLVLIGDPQLTNLPDPIVTASRTHSALPPTKLRRVCEGRYDRWTHPHSSGRSRSQHSRFLESFDAPRREIVVECASGFNGSNGRTCKWQQQRRHPPKK